MLIMLKLSTLYRYEKTEEFEDFRCRSGERRRKRTEEGRMLNQNKCVSSQQIFLRERALP